MFSTKCKDAVKLAPAEAKKHSIMTSSRVHNQHVIKSGRRPHLNPPARPPRGKNSGENSEKDTKRIQKKSKQKFKTNKAEKASKRASQLRIRQKHGQQQGSGPVRDNGDNAKADWPKLTKSYRLEAKLSAKHQWEQPTQNNNKLSSQSNRAAHPALPARLAQLTGSHHKQFGEKGAMEKSAKKFKFRKVVKSDESEIVQKNTKSEASTNQTPKSAIPEHQTHALRHVRRILTYESPTPSRNRPEATMSTNRGRSPGTPGSRGSSGRGRSPGTSAGPQQREGAAQALTPEQRQQRARQVAYWREEILKRSPCREMRFSNELEQMAVDTMVAKYADPDVYVGGTSEAYIEPEFGGREGARDRQKAMADTAHKRYILLSGGCRVSDVMATLHPFLYRRFQEHANNQGRESYDIPRLEGAALDRAQFVCEAFRHEWQQNVTVNARSGVAPPLSMPTAMKLALTEGSTEERMAACQRLLDECDRNKRRAEDGESYKHRMVKAEREVVELRQRAASAPPRVEVGKIYVDNKSGEEVLCIPVGQVNKFLESTGQAWEIAKKPKVKRRVTVVEPEATLPTDVGAPPPSQPSAYSDPTGLEAPMEEDVIELHPRETETGEGWWPPEVTSWEEPGASTAAASEMVITMEGGKIKTVVERASRTEASSTSSESKKRKREVSQPPEVAGKQGRRPVRKAIAAGDESSTSEDERERRWEEAAKVQQNKREGKFPLAGIKSAKKTKRRTSFKPSAKDLKSAAHKMNISPDTHPDHIFEHDPVLDNPLTENQMMAASGGQAAELGSNQPKVACPDILSRRYQCPVKVGAAKTTSQCLELFCAARNPRYSFEEFDGPLQEPYGRLPPEYVSDLASLSEGPFDLTRGRHPKAVIDYGLGGGMEWDDVVRDLDKEGFFKSIEDWSTVSFDTEGYPQKPDRKYSAEAIRDQISVLHLMAPNGVMLQIAINHDGTEKGDPNERGVPDTIRQIFAAETVMKMGFGATEDAEKLMRTEVLKEIRSVCDLHNLALIAFPQFDKEIEHIAVGKRFVAEQLGSPVIFVDNKSKGAPPSHHLTGYRNRRWDFTAPFDIWSDDMVWYNRYDHCIGWVLLHSCAARFAFVEKHRGDLFRAEMFLLCKIRNWRPRLQALDLSNETVRPHADWFGKDTERRPDPQDPSKQLTYEVKARTFYHEDQPSVDLRPGRHEDGALRQDRRDHRTDCTRPQHFRHHQPLLCWR